jgi:FSR family fosmidomycin resistance protein-like MFS transporter
MQPAYGFLSDRFRSRMFTVLAPAVAGVFVSGIALAPSFAWVSALVVLGGAGIASFHPQASARVTLGVKANRGRWMAVFISGGTLGFAIAPTFFTTLIAFAGFESAWIGAIPGLLVTLALLVKLPSDPPPAEGRERPRFDWQALNAVRKPLFILYMLVFLRSVVQVTFAQFIPLYLTRVRGYSLEIASYLLSSYLFAGALGGFIGGHIADRFGGRRVILISMIASVPFLLLFVLGGGPASAAGLCAGGLILLFTIPVNVVMAQELVPGQSGTVSALMMGFAWGTAGMVFIPLTGWFSDLYGMQSVLTVLVLFPLLGFLLALKLPRERASHG